MIDWDRTTLQDKINAVRMLSGDTGFHRVAEWLGGTDSIKRGSE